MLDILSYPEPTMDAPWLGPGKNFKIKVLRRLDSAILKLVFANTVMFSLPIRSFHCYTSKTLPSTLQNLHDFDDAMIQFCLNFLKF